MSTQDIVREQIALQMPDVPSLPDVISDDTAITVSLGTRGNQDVINQAVEAFELKHEDPTNVTAYHDFYNLQIAFEPVWLEVLDKYIGDVASVFNIPLTVLSVLVEISEQIGSLEPGRGAEIKNIDDLERFQAEAGFLIDRIQSIDEPDPMIAFHLMIPPEIWRRIDDPNREKLVHIALQMERVHRQLQSDPSGEELNRLNSEYNDLWHQGDAIVREAENNPDRYSRLKMLVQELGQRLSEPHNFHIFAPDSINFGILVTYRQKWEPKKYQVGDLVSTIPLAPKEVRKFTKKRVIKKSRAVKEIENSLQIRKQDSQDTARTDAEIVNKAENKTNFRLTAEGGFSVGVVNASASTGLTIDSAKASSQTKKDFREAVAKAALEYKQERKLEISTAESDEFEETTSGEISNPNDELPVTYLFYELQRQYEISEKIHRVTPVVLVANEVPAPHDIDEDWLIAHDWILKRVILDDSFLPALDFLSENVVGEEFTLDVLQANLNKQKMIVEQTKEQVISLTESRTTAIEDLEKRIAYLASEIGNEGPEDDDTAAAREREQAARGNLERIERELRDLQSQLSHEVTALEAATEKYTQAFKDHLNRQTEIIRLRIHIKENILYYMQAIWDHEPPDQRYFRLRHLKVIDISPAFRITVSGTVVDGEAGEVEIELETDGPYDIKVSQKRLDDVADLDNLLGYKGTYMIFPLKQNNYVTATMVLSYVDEKTGLRDPGDPANYTMEELISFIEWLHANEPDEFEEKTEALRVLVAERLADPQSKSGLVVVPTDSLYIEALPGAHPLLEDFKILHRALDVKKVRAEVRHAELENIRIMTRLLEGELDDPDIEKKVVVSGDGVTPTIETGRDS